MTTPKMRETPRTDQMVWAMGNKPISPREEEIMDFARQIERENQELRKVCSELLMAAQGGPDPSNKEAWLNWAISCRNAMIQRARAALGEGA